jgi:hypothetical protein
VNTSRQIGGAIGLAAVSAIAANSTDGYARTHANVSASGAVALDHGYQTALYGLTGALIVGALVVVALVRPPKPARAEQVDETLRLEDAA